MKQSYPQSLTDKYGVSMEQILNKKPMSMSKTKLTTQIDSLETSFRLILTHADCCSQYFRTPWHRKPMTATD